MATYDQRIDALQQQITALAALVNGARQDGVLYVVFGNFVKYGTKVTQGLSASDLTLAIDGAASGDSAHLNPNATSSPTRVEEYPNISFVYGVAWLSRNVNMSALDPVDTSLVMDSAPADSGHGRYDIVYVYVSSEGPGQAILKGTSSTAARTDFLANGVKTGAYPQAFDPAGLPHGAFPLARVYIQNGDTGIANARIVDLRTF